MAEPADKQMGNKLCIITKMKNEILILLTY